MEEVSQGASEPDSPVPGVKRPVFILGVVSFLTDVSSEMVYPLVPLFLTSVLGAPLTAVGIIEGLAEGGASLFKTVGGWASDRLRMRRPLVFAGYALSAVAKPLLAAAYVWPVVLLVRFGDRAGKGVRTAPRDALVAEVTPAQVRGRAFGFHRAADTLGAVVGPAVALGLLALFSDNFRLIFILAFIPAVAGVALVSLVRERPPPPAAAGATTSTWRELGVGFYVFLGVSLVFALGNSSDVFLLLRAKDVGLSNSEVVLSYMLFNLVYAVVAMPAGIASDRLGRRNVIGLGFAVFAAVYVGFGLAGGGAVIWPLFAVYGLYMALTEGVGRAFVADFVPSDRRATALGLYQGAMGAMILLSSVIAGALWDIVDPAAPFFLGAATALLALVALVILRPQVAVPPRG
ncbi:MAG: MFS transporter [Chloroflexi bacterium]|nr:MFS transporter [Chloroflexota bacterium]